MVHTVASKPCPGKPGHAGIVWLRGYAPTTVPDDACYSIGALVADAVALHQALDGDGQAVLIGHGGADGNIAVELVRGAERHLAPGSRMIVVEGAGHFPQLEQPEEVNEHILAWATG
jgi:pimeloyl-ACP methyl ester carboxylesterase